MDASFVLNLLPMSHDSNYIRQAEATRVRVLSEALPYIQQFTGRTVVVKYGGAAMKDGSLKDKVIRDVVFLSCVGLRPVVVAKGVLSKETHHTVIRLAPPLIITKAEIDIAIKALHEVFKAARIH